MKVEDHRFGLSEEGLELPVSHAMWVFGVWDQLEKVYNVYESNLYVGRSWRSRAVAARDSMVGTSPQLAMTTSGSWSWSLLAQSHIPAPFVQCAVAASISRYCKCTCLSATMTLT